MKSLASVLSAVLALAVVNSTALADKKPPKPDTKVVVNRAPAAEQPAAPSMTPEQQEALRQAFNLPPGSEVEVEITNRDGGSLRVVDEGRGLGAGAEAIGDKLDQQFTGSPPSVGRGADGSQSAQGGGAEADQSGSALKIPPMPWKNPLFWLGLAALGGCGFCVYARLRRGAMICGAAGVGLLAAAFYPFLLLFAVAGVVLVIALPYIKAEMEAQRNKEALRAVVAGVDHATVPQEAKDAVKAAIGTEADDRDRATIKAVKMADSVGKYED